MPPTAAQLWPSPPKWMPAAAAAAGLIISLLLLGNMSFQPLSGCGGRGYLAPHSPPLARCGTLAEGYPVHWLSAIPSLNLSSGDKVTASNLAISADPAINKSAIAEDVAVWTLLTFATCYLLWLPSRRPAETGTSHQPAPATNAPAPVTDA